MLRTVGDPSTLSVMISLERMRRVGAAQVRRVIALTVSGSEGLSGRKRI